MLILEGNWGEDNTAEGVVLEKALEKGATKDIDKIMKQVRNCIFRLHF